MTLGYFHRFIDIHGGRTAFQSLTTAQVCFQFVVPYTTPSKLSLVDHVRLHTNDATFVKPATWYISHAWSYTFLEVLDSLDSFFADKNDDPVLWFCVFANNQHRAAEMPFSWWQTTFKQSLEAIGNVVMILHPWNNPVTLTRSWCIFEVYVSILVNANFQVAMASNQAAVFFDDILDDISSFHMMLSCVNSRDAKSTVASDKASIDQVIEAEVGFVALDRMVLGRFEQWMRESFEERIASAATNLDKAKYLKSLSELEVLCMSFEDALINFTETYTIYSNELGPDDPKTLLAQGFQAISRGYLVRPQAEWEPVLVDVVAKLEKKLGPMHEDTINCMLQLGNLYGETLQKPRKAIKILRVAYTRSEKAFGPKAHQTFNARIGYILHQRELISAKAFQALMNECVEEARNVFGPNHPTTLMAVSSILPMEISNCGHEKVFEVYETCRRIFGDDHPRTLDMALKLSGAYINEKLLDLALEQLNHIVTITQGKSDVYKSVFYSCALYLGGGMHFKLGNLNMAVEMLEKVFEEISAGNMISEHLDIVQDSMRNLYWSHYQLGMTLENVNTLTEILQRFKYWQEKWFDTLCDDCGYQCVGVIFMCSSCTCLTICYCPWCYRKKIDYKCTRCSKDTFVPMLPPARMLLRKKYELLLAADSDLTNIHGDIDKYCKKYKLTIDDVLGPIQAKDSMPRRWWCFKCLAF